MAIIIKTHNPNLLLDKIYEGIATRKVEKWTVMTDGRITPSPLLWKNEAFLKPQIWVEENELRFGLLKRKDRRHVTSKLYTFFHAKFVEMLLANFDTDFQEVTITALSTPPDNF
ncbi:MAG: hypothetical protein PHT14_03225 [Petrimonas sp.]|jgi:predicted NACHT family NTPase|uniref:Uncharacterized protein n=1 Tax=bioreactor metagenome TaxID=1076179 RepID=A0A645AJ38_9ZZZZ|nr:hypothetical protein [Petrimonas sp.]NLU30262.1 hypothetical protein [Bacteroidales bacterium]BBD45824.1 Hypothetical protein PEIBARAKI_5817 [Petrimonas sp. IBARAKI]HAC72532.1 hypothetical protein [Porphyromonadaceae bacterium]MDD2910243.1 hypothetical protein [Petrimonas sp.]